MKKDKVAPNIIDNSPGRELQRVIKDQLKKSKEAKFAIGYFFLSGFNLVKEDFPSNYKKLPFLKIIMGNETTYPTKEELVEGYRLRDLFKQRMIEELQSVELTPQQIENLKMLRDFVANNIIDVKLFEKSRLHAKLYLFLTKPEEKYGSPGLAVVGSSNFTAEGLTQNRELNVLLTSREEVLYLNQWFEELWKEAIEFREDLIKVIDYSGIFPESPYPKIGKLVDPQTLFKYLVYKWFEGRVLELPEKNVLMEFQIVGVMNSTETVNYYNGAILADSVGLGKSFMASAVIQEFIMKKHPAWLPPDNTKPPSVLLILPPSLIPQWEELLIGKIGKKEQEELEKGKVIPIDSEYFFTKNLKKLLKKENSNKTYEIYDEKGKTVIGRISFLSMGIFQNYKVNDNYVAPELTKLADEYDLFVIDEAHKYRNKNTNRWKAARKLQRKSNGFPNKFLLLTATPLNNSIYDIYNLIRIFVDDSFAPFHAKETPIVDLVRKYQNLKKELRKKNDDKLKKDLKEIATQIKKKVLNEIMILRTRKYIMEQFKDIKVDGKPLIFKDPQPYSLDYSSFYSKSYKNLLKLIERNLDKISFEHTKLYGRRFVVFEEETPTDEEEASKYYIEIADLFKLLLGKRLESGIYPFETTLRRIYEKEKIFYEILKPQIEEILDDKTFLDLLQKAVEKAKIEVELEEALEEYTVDEQETIIDRIKEIIYNYAEQEKETGKEYTDNELLKLGLRKILEILENDLRKMDEIFDEIDQLKQKVNGNFKTYGKIPRKEEDIVDIPIFSYTLDPKFEALKQLIGPSSFKSEKLKDIPSLNGKKIIIFTQYKDTAYYLYNNLIDWIKEEVDLHFWLKDEKDRIKIGLVTGDTETPTKVNFMKRFAPEANNGFEEVKKFGEIDILISTDALSEGVNLQDADAVINYDLPWNPMVIVQRVGRVNRIGNEKDVIVVNFIPSNEIEIIVGILKKLREKIEDITLVVGKETRILSPEEEISVETFGEKIKDISKKKMTDLELYGISEDFKEFIPEGIPQEQLDAYKLLNIVQYELGYTPKDFEEIKKMPEDTYYSYIEGENKIISIYEFYRGQYKIDKKIMSINPVTKEIKYDTPLVFLDLIKNKQKPPQNIENAIESLKSAKQEIDKIIEESREKYQLNQKGFLYHLYNSLLIQREKAKNFENKFKAVMNALQVLPYYWYSKDVKALLTKKSLIEVNRDNVIIKNFKGVIDTLYEFFKQKGIADMESQKSRVNHIGWYYEIRIG